MTDALTTGSERLAAVAVSTIQPDGESDHLDLLQAVQPAIATDPGVKALVERLLFRVSHYQGNENNCTCEVCGECADKDAAALRKWEHGDAS